MLDLNLYTARMSLHRIFLFYALIALLGCQRGVTLRQFERLDIYKTPYIELAVPQGLFPVKGNEAVFKKIFGDAPQGKASFEMLLHSSDGIFLDPKGLGEGRSQMAIFDAKPAENGCEDRMRRIAKTAPLMGGAKTEIIAGKQWETLYSSNDRALNFHRCERGIYWFLVFKNSNAPDRLALFTWAKPSVESAK